MNQVSKIMSISFITNFFLATIKLISGFLGGSGALIADGFHSFSDLFTDLVAIGGTKLSSKPADEKHPYGHGKIEYITSILISIVILFLGLSIIREAFHKEIVIPSLFVAGISMLTILVKYLLATYILTKGKKLKNNVLIASGKESKTDVYSSIVVFLSILLMQESKKIPILQYADILATLLVGVLILKIGFSILKENMSLILEEQETDETYLQKIRKIILQKKEIHHIDELKVLKYGSYLKIDAEVSMNPFSSLLKSHHIIHEVENLLRAFDERILYITIHANPDESYELITKPKKSQIEELYHKKNALDKLTKEQKKLLEKYLSSYQIIEIEGKPNGFLLSYPIDEKTLWLEELYIMKQFRYCGLGTDIIQKIIMKDPHQEIKTKIIASDLFAIHFLQKCGFKKEKEENSFYIMKYKKKKIPEKKNS